jgi:hypothetical protein
MTAARADVLVLAQQFLASPYARMEFVNWSLDQRVERFLHSRGLSHLADDGDSMRDLVDRILHCHGCGGFSADHCCQAASCRAEIRQ